MYLFYPDAEINAQLTVTSWSAVVAGAAERVKQKSEQTAVTWVTGFFFFRSRLEQNRSRTSRCKSDMNSQIQLESCKSWSQRMRTRCSCSACPAPWSTWDTEKNAERYFECLGRRRQAFGWNTAECVWHLKQWAASHCIYNPVSVCWSWLCGSGGHFTALVTWGNLTFK